MKTLRNALASTVIAFALMCGILALPAAVDAENASVDTTTIDISERRDGRVDAVQYQRQDGDWRRIDLRENMRINRAVRYAARRCDLAGAYEVHRLERRATAADGSGDRVKACEIDRRTHVYFHHNRGRGGYGDD